MKVTAHNSLANETPPPRKPSIFGSYGFKSADLPVKNEQLRMKLDQSATCPHCGGAQLDIERVYETKHNGVRFLFCS